MEISLRRGLLEAGLTACISSFCLTSVPAWSQTDGEPNLSTIREPGLPDWVAAQRIETQQQAVLTAVEHIQDQSKAALNRYTETILAQFDLLQQNFASQRGELNALQQINHSTRAMVQVMMVVALASLVVVAWIPLWAASRMSKRILAVARQRASAIRTTQIGELDLEVPSLESALERLEQRLLALEHSPVPAVGAEPVQPATATPVTALRRASDMPRVALRMGEGSALFFVPHEGPGLKTNALQRQWMKLKKLLARAPAPQKT